MLIALIKSRRSIRKAIRFARYANRLAIAYDHQAELCVCASPLGDFRSRLEGLARKEREHRDEMLAAARTVSNSTRLVAKYLKQKTIDAVGSILPLALIIFL